MQNRILSAQNETRKFQSAVVPFEGMYAATAVVAAVALASKLKLPLQRGWWVTLLRYRGLGDGVFGHSLAVVLLFVVLLLCCRLRGGRHVPVLKARGWARTGRYFVVEHDHEEDGNTARCTDLCIWRVLLPRASLMHVGYTRDLSVESALRR